MSKFAAFDIDGTLIRWQLFHAIVHGLGKRGYIPLDAHERIRAARKEWKERTSNNGFAAYEEVLVQEYISALRNVTSEQYSEIVQEVFAEYKDQTYTYTRDLIKGLKAEGYVLLAISGSHQEVIEQLGKYHGFDHVVGAKFEQSEGKFTGNLDSPVFDKAKALKKLVKEYELTLEGSIAVGDSHSDVAMLDIVENPICFNPDRRLFEVAKERQWKVVVERKNMVYELEPKDGCYVLS